jgi:hypothetical protein
MRVKSTVIAMLLTGTCAQVTAALPAISPSAQHTESLVQPVASWRYDRRCAWRGGRWVVDLNEGKVLLCRPERPGRQWAWRAENGRQGWYDRRRQLWHYNGW